MSSMFLKEITIQNIQSHKDSSLSLSPHVNAIIGLSDHGKTAIIRALLLLIRNRPMGADYMPNSVKDKCTGVVKVITNEGKEISLEKEFRVNKKGGKVVDSSVYHICGSPYETGKDVPDIIKEELNFDSLNIHEQLDLPFLVTSTDGKLAKDINRITHLEPVDSWLSSLTTKINDLNSTKKFLQDEIKQKEAKLKEYEDLPTLEALLDKATVIEGRMKKWMGRIKRLNTAMDSIIDLTNKAGIISLKLRAEWIVSKAQVIDSKVEQGESKKTRLNSILSIDSRINDISPRLDHIIPVWERIVKVSGIIEGISPSSLSSIIKSLEENQRSFKQIQEEYEETKEQYIAQIKDEKICPFCLSKIDDKIIDRIQEAL